VIHLNDDEWGNKTMERVSKEYFDAEPSCNFVEVYEHGGWFLCWRRDGSIWGTANDMAVLKKSQPTPIRCERSIRRGTDDDYWMLNGKTHPALKVAA
jgi:hypothetical protein